MNNDRLPPHDIEAEANVLASILIDPDIILKLSSTIRPNDFYREKHRWIYEAMLALVARDEGIDQATVYAQLTHAGRAEDCGGEAYLSHICSQCPTSVHGPYYAQAVKRCSLARQLIVVAGEIAGRAYTAGPNIDEVIRESQDAILRVRTTETTSMLVSPPEVGRIAEDLYTGRRDNKDWDVIKYGYMDIDWATGGAHKGDLVLLGGRPRIGKSALAQGFARNMSKEHTVLYCSTEMTMNQLIDREMAVLLKVPTSVLTEGGYDDNLFGNLIWSASKLVDRRLFYVAGQALTTGDIHWAAAQVKAERGLDVVVVDYVQQLNDEYGRSQNERVSFISRRLKTLAISLNVVVIGLSQLSREVEKEKLNKRPRLSDLRDSGSLEQDADVVMFLYRDDAYYNEEEWQEAFKGKKPFPKGIAEINIAKQRQRESNITHQLTWVGRTMEYLDYSDRPRESAVSWT